jgi:D-3-phosphoglycerate dehydrogenase
MKILVCDKIDKKALQGLGEFADVITNFEITPDQLKEQVKEYDALIIRSRTKVTREIIEASNLKVIARAGVGLDNIDLDAAKERRIKIINTPGASSIAVAELAIGLMLALLRNISKGDSGIKEGRWEKKQLLGGEICGKVVGIIGMGRIGKEVSKRLKNWGCEILGCDPSIDEDTMQKVGAKKVELATLLKNSDIVTIHVPLSPKTRKMIGKKQIGMMKDDAILIHTARGGIVDEAAVYEALKSGKLAGAGFDVFENEPYLGPLAELENVVLTPHIGANTKEAQARIGKELVEKMRETIA